MKLPSVVLLFSAALNAVILGVFAVRPSLAPPSFHDAFRFGTGTTDAGAADAKSRTRAARPEAARKLWPLLATEDLPALVERLRAAGFPTAIIREIVRAEVNSRYDARLRAFTESDANTPFWKAPTNIFTPGSARMEEYSRLQRERSRILRDLFADPFFASEDVEASQIRQFGNLSRQKVDLVKRIEDDYGDMNAAIRAGLNGITLPEDRAKLDLLAREKRADLAAVLSESEMADYEMRTSTITRLLKQQMGDFHATEAEFKALFRLQQAMNEKFPYTSGTIGNTMGDRRLAQQELDLQLRAQFGDARYNDYQRETSSDYQQLRALAARANLPADTAVRAFEMRNLVSQESLRIVNEATLGTEQKRAALASLAQNTRSQLITLLGPTAGPTWVKQVDTQWLNTVERGAGVTFDGGPNHSIGSDNVMVSFGNGPRYRNLPPANLPPRQ